MEDSERSDRIAEDFDRLDDGACFEIDVTGHKLSVRKENDRLVGVRHKPDEVIVPSHEKDAEFVRRMMAWKGYRQVPRDEPPFDSEQQAGQQTLVTDGGTDTSGIEREEPDEIISNGGRNSDGSPRMLSRWTFEYAPARRIVEEYIHGRTLNACAGKTKLQHNGEIIRNDLNPERDADTHLDVAEIADHFEPRSFDTVIFDPPFDQKQADEKYDGLHASDVYAALGQFNELVGVGGHVITFGWNSWGMRSFPAFERLETVLLQRGPIHRDFIVSVDHRATSSLADGGWNNRSVDTDPDQEVRDR